MSRPLMSRAPWQSGSLPVNSRLQLPLWLARSLQQRYHIQLELPACYGSSYREGMRSNPGHMNLRDHSEYYFEIGKDLCSKDLCAAPPTTRRPPPATRHALARPPALPIYCRMALDRTHLCNPMRSHAMHGV